MTIYNIPVQNNIDANNLSVSLSGDIYELAFRFNSNESKWYMDVIKNLNVILSGIKLVSSNDLLAQFKAYDIPFGRLFIFDKNGLFSDPDGSNFGESVFLRYDDKL